MRKPKVKKEWYTIIAPPYLNEIEVGHTLASEPKKLIGRRLWVSAMNALNDFSKYYLKVAFIITQVDGKVAKTDFFGSECLREYIARMVVRRTTRIDVVQDVLTQDNRKIRVKSIAIFPGKVRGKIKKVIRKKIYETVEKMVSQATLADFVTKLLLKDELKKKVSKELRKIYPLRNYEIRKTEVLE